MSQSITNATDFEIGYAIGFLSAKGGQFSTIDIISKIVGSYQCDTGIPADSSPNALFGKKLSKNKANYRIERVLEPDDKLGQDESGNKTTTAIWRSALLE